MCSQSLQIEILPPDPLVNRVYARYCLLSNPSMADSHKLATPVHFYNRSHHMLHHINIWIINELWLHTLKTDLTHNIALTTTAASIDMATLLSTLLQMISVPLTAIPEGKLSVLTHVTLS